MPARTNRICCGRSNLAKIDPATGAFIWKAFVGPAGSGGGAAYNVQPLYDGSHGCVVAKVNDSVSGTYDTLGVNSDGSTIWERAGDQSYPASESFRMLTTAGDGYIYRVPRRGGGTNPHLPSATVEKLDPGDGSTVASNNFSVSGSLTLNSVGSLAGRSSGFIALVSTDNGAGGSTNLTSFFSGSFGTNWSSSSPLSHGLASSMTGDYCSAAGRISDGTNGATIGSISIFQNRCNWCPNDAFAAGSFSTNRLTAIRNNAGSVVQDFAINTVDGASTSSTDCWSGCGDGSYYYFVIDQITGTTFGRLNIVCTDLYGSVQWVQNFGATGGTPVNAFDCCMSDDGYLYVAGTGE